ncbi:hypothetical protein J4Q44_G00302590 [Coregonus suidteri]|uniref:Uncharacterized protein n=1 Tax=Coregonus suidteri TaxID=861788 RepID=A0AAN8KPV4_9TELE
MRETWIYTTVAKNRERGRYLDIHSTTLITAMRPRSKLLSQKRRLQLPTIREGFEDLVRDINQLNQMNQSNTLHSAQPTAHPGPCPHTLSSEDYLLSICHLAHPTSLPTNDIINPRQQDSLNQRPRLPRHTWQDENSPKTTALCHREKAHGKDRVEPGMYSDLITVCGGQEKDSNCSKPAFGSHGASDPLEFLYSSPAHSTCQSGNGRQGLGLRRHWAVSEGQSCPRAHSYPRSCPSDLQQQPLTDMHTYTGLCRTATG